MPLPYFLSKYDRIGLKLTIANQIQIVSVIFIYNSLTLSLNTYHIQKAILFLLTIQYAIMAQAGSEMVVFFKSRSELKEK